MSDDDTPPPPPRLIRTDAVMTTPTTFTCVRCHKQVLDIINGKCHECQASANDGRRRRSKKRRSKKRSSKKRRSKKKNY
jgi:predicted ATP-dependent serine protease